MSSKNNGKKSNNIQYVLMDDNRTLASYGIVGSSDDIYTLQMVVVPPLTQEEIEALQRKVYNAAEAGDSPRMQTAIQAVKDGGADLNWRNIRGQTSVWIATRNGSDGCLSQLIAAGADVNIADNDGETPVWSAAYHGNDRFLSQMIAAGANVDTPTNDGETPLQVATSRHKTSCAALLRAAGAK
jgi:ankyrin repeat protein